MARKLTSKTTHTHVTDQVCHRAGMLTVWCQQSVDARVSEDAGRYLCDFIYYSSLAELTKKKEERRVMFFHVPADCDEEAIQKGVNMTLNLIRALVDSDRVRKLAQVHES